LDEFVNQVTSAVAAIESHTRTARGSCMQNSFSLAFPMEPIWVGTVHCANLLEEWGIFELHPEEIAHTLIDGGHGNFTETWPMSFDYDDESVAHAEDESGDGDHASDKDTVTFLKSIAPQTRKKNLSMV
jgi:hypothetical protein